MESRHLLNLSVQNSLDCMSKNFNLKNFPGGACARLEKCAVRGRIVLKHKLCMFCSPWSVNALNNTEFAKDYQCQHETTRIVTQNSMVSY